VTDADNQSDLNELLLLNAKAGSLLHKSDEIEETLRRVKELIGQGADTNYAPEGGSSVLDTTISVGDLKVVQLLLDNGAKITNSSVMLACNRVGRAEAAYSYLADVFKRDNTFLKLNIAAVQQIALAVIAKATKDDFIRVNLDGKTVLDLAAPSATVTAALKEALLRHGLTEADLSAPKAVNPATAKNPRPGQGLNP
jgi:hypothetical protein